MTSFFVISAIWADIINCPFFFLSFSGQSVAWSNRYNWNNYSYTGWYTSTNDVPLPQRMLTISWDALGEVLPAGQKRWSSSSNQNWWGHTWKAMYNFGFSSMWETRSFWIDPMKGKKDDEGTGALVIWGETERAGIVQHGEDWGMDLSNIYKCLKETFRWWNWVLVT